MHWLYCCESLYITKNVIYAFLSLSLLIKDSHFNYSYVNHLPTTKNTTNTNNSTCTLIQSTQLFSPPQSSRTFLRSFRWRHPRAPPRYWRAWRRSPTHPSTPLSTLTSSPLWAASSGTTVDQRYWVGGAGLCVGCSITLIYNCVK